ncbi:MAG: hypothetical protein M5R36_24325 [Deltaproteobacteria bacterium]|nr:hypothetical protein [Deltaproteobacteria bacterium]
MRHGQIHFRQRDAEGARGLERPAERRVINDLHFEGGKILAGVTGFFQRQQNFSLRRFARLHGLAADEAGPQRRLVPGGQQHFEKLLAVVAHRVNRLRDAVAVVRDLHDVVRRVDGGGKDGLRLVAHDAQAAVERMPQILEGQHDGVGRPAAQSGGKLLRVHRLQSLDFFGRDLDTAGDLHGEVAAVALDVPRGDRRQREFEAFVLRRFSSTTVSA